MSFFGGPEARQRVADLDASVTKLQARIKAAHKTDKDVDAALEDAQTWLKAGWVSVSNFIDQWPVDSLSHIRAADSNAQRGELAVLKANQFLDALGDSKPVAESTLPLPPQ